ncbi:type II toxin-antitoxin system RelE/ParE family toxin [bacterium]|nr:type II toxin-antitoxin system RelE/ParE family toxin [bacterium]MBU1754629.1 type II toxin-antitoxin system RelE/ParE family toxin [bacterium]
MKISLLPLAQIELDDAFSWYEEQVVGLGYEFLDEFDQSVRLIASFPELFEQIEMGVRRCLINRFPYGIIYGIDSDKIVIIAVAHLKRKPNYWIKRKKF